MPIPVTCRVCGTVVVVPPSEAKRRKFCSSACAARATTPARPEKGLRTACTGCGAATYVYPVHVKRNKTGRHFCSAACRRTFDSRSRIQVVCAYCGRETSRPQSNQRTEGPLFCSMRCHNTYHRGERHARWTGGTQRYRGRDWKEQRLKALHRDAYTCQHCQNGDRVQLDVHHIIPYRISHSNDLSNLITLCDSCHMKADEAFRRDQRAKTQKSGASVEPR